MKNIETINLKNGDVVVIELDPQLTPYVYNPDFEIAMKKLVAEISIDLNDNSKIHAIILHPLTKLTILKKDSFPNTKEFNHVDIPENMTLTEAFQKIKNRK